MLKQTLISINNVLDELKNITKQDIIDIKKANHNDLFERNNRKNELIKQFSELKSQIDTTYWCRKNWKIHLHPLFLLKSLFSIRSITDFKIAFRGLKSLLGHIRDY